jgi:quercetin dioxygenase-like cupin family protein
MVLGAPALAEGSLDEGGSDVMRAFVIGAAALLSACVSVNANVTTAHDAALEAIENARVRECPADRTQANARNEGFGPSSGVESADIALTPLASDPTRAVRLRRIVVQPGGVIPWHDHAQIQGMALLVSGEMVELRNTCLDPITYRAGDVAREDDATAHSWRNEGDSEAVIIVAHVVPR